MNPNKKHSASALAYEFPDMKLELETAALEHTLSTKLGFKGEVAVYGKTAEIKIQLNGEFTLTLTPNNVGFDGYGTWYEWHQLFNPMTGSTEDFAILRAVAKIESSDPAFGEPLTFTVFDRTLKGIVELSMKKAKKFRAKRLYPVLIQDIEVSEE